MKIGIYSPYLDSFGGGERYVLTTAEILAISCKVDLLLDSHHLTLQPKTLISDLGKRFNLNLEKINLVEVPMGRGINTIKRLLFFRSYDLLIYLTDGSIFYSTARRGIIHFQVPFKNYKTRDLWGKIKASTWNLAVCNSKFTEGFIKKEWPFKTTVIYPPVDISKIKPLKKKNYILSVGRFASFTKAKKHEEMIKTFIRLCRNKEMKGWSLHLVGSVEGDEGYIDELKELAGKNPVFFYPNLSFDRLVALYGQSTIYWHASGFGEDDPTKMEHFGITTVEAMAGGCVPIVINSGGQPEIVENNKSGMLWSNLSELGQKTLQIVNNNKLWSKLSNNARKRSNLFSKNYFKEKILSLIRSP